MFKTEKTIPIQSWLEYVIYSAFFNILWNFKYKNHLITYYLALSINNKPCRHATKIEIRVYIQQN